MAIPGPARPMRRDRGARNGGMARLLALKIYTRGGDAGETVLIGGVRVRKSDPRVAAYGRVDELGAAIGLALALDGHAGHLDADRVRAIQEDLFTIGARLAAAEPARALEKGTIPTLDAARIETLERWIDEMDEELPALDAFVLSGGSPAGAQLHVARTVCRRAERRIVGLLDDQPDLARVIVPYLNRLSDLLFTLARFANARAGSPEPAWVPQRQRTPDDGRANDGRAASSAEGGT